jgi:hypothetical protein
LHAFRAVELEGDSEVTRSIEAYRVIPEERFRDFDESHTPGEPAIVPPVGVERGNALAHAFVVDLDDERIVALGEIGGQFDFERCKAPCVLGELTAIDEYASVVVGRPEAQEPTFPYSVRRVEVPAVPERAFVPEELGEL